MLSPQIRFVELNTGIIPVRTNVRNRVCPIGNFDRGPVNSFRYLTGFTDFANTYGSNTEEGSIAVQAIYDQGAENLGVVRVLGRQKQARGSINFSGNASINNEINLTLRFIGEATDRNPSSPEAIDIRVGSRLGLTYYSGETSGRYFFRVVEDVNSSPILDPIWKVKYQFVPLDGILAPWNEVEDYFLVPENGKGPYYITDADTLSDEATGTKASGEVTISNNNTLASRSITISRGTIIGTAPNGILFATTNLEPVVIDPNDSATLPVTALLPGTAGNVSANQIDTFVVTDIPDTILALVEVTNSSPLTGGANGSAPLSLNGVQPVFGSSGDQKIFLKEGNEFSIRTNVDLFTIEIFAGSNTFDLANTTLNALSGNLPIGDVQLNSQGDGVVFFLDNLIPGIQGNRYFYKAELQENDPNLTVVYGLSDTGFVPMTLGEDGPSVATVDVYTLDSEPLLRFQSTSPGNWGNSVLLSIFPLDRSTFRLTVRDLVAANFNPPIPEEVFTISTLPERVGTNGELLDLEGSNFITGVFLPKAISVGLETGPYNQALHFKSPQRLAPSIPSKFLVRAEGEVTITNPTLSAINLLANTSISTSGPNPVEFITLNNTTLPIPAAVRATGVVTFTNNSGGSININPGTIVTAGSVQFETTNASPTPIADTASANINVRAVLGGPSGNVAINAINALGTPISGVTVANAAATTGGSNGTETVTIRAVVPGNGGNIPANTSLSGPPSLSFSNPSSFTNGSEAEASDDTANPLDVDRDPNHPFAFGINWLTDFTLEGGTEGPVVTEDDYISALKEIEPFPVHIVLCAGPQRFKTSNRIRQALITHVENSNEENGLRVAILAARPNLSPNAAKRESSGLSTVSGRAVLVTGYSTYIGQNTPLFSLPPDVLYAGKLSVTPFFAGPHAAQSAGPVRGITNVDNRSFTSRAGLQLYTDARLEVLYLDEANSSFVFHNARTLATGIFDKIFIRRSYDFIRQDIYLLVSQYKNEPHTNQLRVQLAAAIDAYMQDKLTARQIWNYSPTIIDSTNNSIANYIEGRLNITVSFLPVYAAEIITITLIRDTQTGNVSLGI